MLYIGLILYYQWDNRGEMTMAYTVKKLSKLSGVSIRTLHFYDEIGLLKPAYYGENGYRYYEEKQLLLLQQILFFRELGFELKKIQKLLGRSDFDQLVALCSHREVLQKNLERTKELIETIDKTIQHLKGTKTMEDKEMYAGFSKEKQAEYEKYLVERFGESVKIPLAESKRKTEKWSEADWRRVKDEGEAINRALAELVDYEPNAAEVQTLIDQHYAWIKRFWTPNRRSYIELGELYDDHPDFQKFFAASHPKLARFLADAMRYYAEHSLEA